MAKKNLRDNSSASPEELLKKAAEKLVEKGLVIESTEDSLKDKVADTFEYYPEVEFLWVCEDGTAFTPKNLHYAHQYANSKNQKIYKIFR
jgi:hypothetical protein